MILFVFFLYFLSYVESTALPPVSFIDDPIVVTIDSVLENDYSTIISEYIDKDATFMNISNAIIDLGIKYPDFVFKQTIKESGMSRDKSTYTSILAVRYNNLFGMKKARSRETTALDNTYNGYATYEHWIYSIIDYKLWQDMVKVKKNETYSSYLGRRKYAQDTKKYGKNVSRIELEDDILNILNASKVNDK